MVQRAAVFLKSVSELNKKISDDPFVAEIAERFHCYFFCEDENQEAIGSLGYHSVIRLYRAWPKSLTYVDNHADSASVQRCIYVKAEIEKTWIMSVDAWFLMPEKYKSALEYLSPHVYFFDTTEAIQKI